MKTPIFLTPEDQLQIRSVLDLKAPGPKPTTEQATALKKILSKAKAAQLDGEPESWIGLGDQVSLVSPKDSSDYFNLRVVMPAEANPDEDLLSVLLPISLAVIGRRCGENVSWETPNGKRSMRVVAVSKTEKMFA